MTTDTISSMDAFNALTLSLGHGVAIDVRSPGEFESARFSGTKNFPILSDEHRHLVGLAYKKKGADQAEKLGHQLVSGSYRDQMIESWCKEISLAKSPALVLCWRGGLRSQISQQWIHDAGNNIVKVEGGYKSLRTIALETIKKSRNYLILGGPTGSGKTELLKKAPNFVDLEGIANHRGSAFGLRLNEEQPTQANFENDLALALNHRNGPILLEDESRLIGRRHLCDEIYDQMVLAPMVLLSIPRSQRALHIYREYVHDPIAHGTGAIDLSANYQNCVHRIRKSLGGLHADQCLELMKIAFDINDQSAHMEWIVFLLENYYDKLYAYSLSKKDRKTIFEGNHQACLDFLQNKLPNSKPPSNLEFNRNPSGT